MVWEVPPRHGEMASRLAGWSSQTDTVTRFANP